MEVLKLVSEMRLIELDIHLHRKGLEKRLQWWQLGNLRKGSVVISEGEPRRAAMKLLDLQAQWAAYSSYLGILLDSHSHNSPKSSMVSSGGIECESLSC